MQEIYKLKLVGKHIFRNFAAALKENQNIVTSASVLPSLTRSSIDRR